MLAGQGRTGLVARGCVVGLSAVLALPAAAQAGTPGETESLGKSKGVEYARAKYRNVTTQTQQAVQCDGDAEVSGGGGSIGGGADASVLHESYPATAPFGWIAEGSTTDGARTLTGYAICAGIDLEHDMSESALDSNVTLFGNTACGAGEEPVGGGGEATGAGILLIGSLPRLPPSSPVGWSPMAYNPTIDDTLFRSHGICSEPGSYRYRESEPQRARVDESATAVAHCKPSEVVLGGGFAATRGDVVGYRAHAVATKPVDSKADGNKVPDDGWLAELHNRHTQRVDVVAHAVCRGPAA